MGIPLVIDTDTAADDCFALLVGLLDPRADLRAITIVGGNVGFEQQVHNAFLTVDVAGRRGEVPVHLGAADPLRRPWVSAIEVHGDGVGGQRRATDDDQRPSDEGAVDALVRLAREHRGELRLVCIGPLTNIALALRADPDFVSNVHSLTVMGGSLHGRGNITPAAEYNVYVDPDAAQEVFTAGFADVTVVTWDPVSVRDTVFTAERIEEIEALDTTLSSFFLRANEATFGFDSAAGIGGSTHPDSLTALIALDPSIVLAAGAYRLDVETESELTLGHTVFDWRAAAPNVRVVERADGPAFYAYMRDLLARH